ASAFTFPAFGKTRKLEIGHTGLTWIPLGGQLVPPPATQPMVDPQYVKQAIVDISSLGFRGVEFFGNQIEAMEADGGVGKHLEMHKLPLISAYCGTNLTDPAQRKDAIAKTIGWARLVKKYGGKVIVVGPNGVKRDTYKFADNKANIVATLNELGKAVQDVGLTAVLHQHTGTCVESREETYDVLHTVDTRVMKFGPDIGQLQKGSVDPVQVVKDFLPIIHHMHLKDYNGGDKFLGYCPLGQGKVALTAILDLMEGRKMDGRVMVELDSPPPQPVAAIETAKIAKAFLEKQGIKFKA
ncbi:MAG TPA: sugar phosphate isomerase/epimerase family protein, partial [Bryobacteraceae bacterium]|nr:sugar phosphate isomerase/epimerase family protein [Bryobacteraceae bacterium]